MPPKKAVVNVKKLATYNENDTNKKALVNVKSLAT